MNRDKDLVHVFSLLQDDFWSRKWIANHAPWLLGEAIALCCKIQIYNTPFLWKFYSNFNYSLIVLQYMI